MDDLKKLFAILHNLHPDIDYNSHRALMDDSVLDSFDIVSIMAEINKEFKVRIPVEEITPKNFNSVYSIMDMVKRLEDDE